jgi:hypothetical protein
MKISWKDGIVLIQEIRKQKYKPNDWEEKFLHGFENCHEKTKHISGDGADFTSKEGNVLMNIYSKAVGGGIYQGRLIK